MIMKLEFNIEQTNEKNRLIKSITEDIKNILNDINLKYLELDKNYCDSEEKDKLDKILIDYLDYIKDEYPNSFESYSDILDLYVKTYKKVYEDTSSIIHK